MIFAGALIILALLVGFLVGSSMGFGYGYTLGQHDSTRNDSTIH
jgi:hypothetical protein